MEEYAREPCPWRIIDDCGGAFAMGSIGGSLFQFIKGFRNAPSGFGRRLQVIYSDINTLVTTEKEILNKTFENM